MTLFPLVWINYLHFSVSSATLDTYVPMTLLLSFQCLLVPPSIFYQSVSQNPQHFFSSFLLGLGIFLDFWVCVFLKHLLFLSILNLQLHQSSKICTIVTDHTHICSHWVWTQIYKWKRYLLINLQFKQNIQTPPQKIATTESANSLLRFCPKYFIYPVTR